VAYPYRPTKGPDLPSVLDQPHGRCRSEVAAARLLRILPAVLLYSPVDGSQPRTRGQHTETGQADRTLRSPPNIAASSGTSSPHTNIDHSQDLPIDESLLYGTQPTAWAACPRPHKACPFSSLTHSRSGWPGFRQRASARCAACRRTPEMPFSSTAPISVKVTSTPAEASTTSWLTRTSPGRAYSAIREARFTVRP
jgi:hypothetical protein